MTARDKFHEGQRVKMTPQALAQRLDGYKAKRRTGVVKDFKVIGFASDPALLVRIVRDGERVAKTYHVSFWEPDETAT